MKIRGELAKHARKIVKPLIQKRIKKQKDFSRLASTPSQNVHFLVL